MLLFQGRGEAFEIKTNYFLKVKAFFIFLGPLFNPRDPLSPKDQDNTLSKTSPPFRFFDRLLTFANPLQNQPPL